MPVTEQMTPEQLTRAASEMKAALARLGIKPGHTTEAQLAQDDAEILPALVNGRPVINSGMSEGPEISAQNRAYPIKNDA